MVLGSKRRNAKGETSLRSRQTVWEEDNLKGWGFRKEKRPPKLHEREPARIKGSRYLSTMIKKGTELVKGVSPVLRPHTCIEKSQR